MTSTNLSNSFNFSSSGGIKNFKIKQKVDEVKEVIQNKPEADIVKVLEYFDNDVGKTIDAFINDGGKEALLKWAEIRQQKQANMKKQSAEPQTGENNGTVPLLNGTDKKNSKNRKTDNNNNKTASNRRNINDLVASLIDECTTNKPVQSETSSSTSFDASILENLNNLVQPSLLAKGLGGLKVTVLGVETMKNASPTVSSVSSSSSPISTATSDNKLPTVQLNQQTTDRPNLLELKPQTVQNQPQAQQQLNSVKTFNKNVNNPNSKKVLEKSQKDLQRQTNILSKISTSFNEDVSKGQIIFEQTFEKLRQLLNERQSQLQVQLNQVTQSASNLIAQRQNKAAELKVMSDNAVHLNDEEALELKADIKHFVSERNLDEEFQKMKLFQEANLDKICEAIKSFGTVAQLNNQYATQRPPLNEIINNLASPLSPMPTPTTSNADQSLIKLGVPVNGKILQSAGLTNGNHGSNDKKNNNKKLNNSNGNRIEIQEVDDDEGKFIEVKKPQRNRNKPLQTQPHVNQVTVQQQQQQKQPLPQRSTPNGNVNAYPSNGQSFNQQNVSAPRINGATNKNPNNLSQTQRPVTALNGH